MHRRRFGPALALAVTGMLAVATAAVRATDTGSLPALALLEFTYTETKDGGLQVMLVRNGDPKNVALVRDHLRREAAAFARGDFSDPALIAGSTMPGLAELRDADGRVAVRYVQRTYGAGLRYITSDPALVAAIHQWFAAQAKATRSVRSR